MTTLLSSNCYPRCIINLYETLYFENIYKALGFVNDKDEFFISIIIGMFSVFIHPLPFLIHFL
jgi:hypothetical protein